MNCEQLLLRNVYLQKTNNRNNINKKKKQFNLFFFIINNLLDYYLDISSILLNFCSTAIKRSLLSSFINIFLANFSIIIFKPLSANPTQWSNTLKQFVGKLPTNCLSVFDHFVRLALKGLKKLL